MSQTPLLAELEGRLVRLEPLVPAHIEPLAAAAAEDPSIFRWFADDLSSVTAVSAWVGFAVAAAAAGRQAPYAVRRRADGRIVGATRFAAIVPKHRRAEIGWTWYARSVWSTGINVECKRLLLGHAFETCGLRRVEFKTDALNERSRGALTALGAVFEGVLRQHMARPDGTQRDSAYFSVTAPEWPELRETLDARLARWVAAAPGD